MMGCVYLDYFPYESLRPYQDAMLDGVYDAVSVGDHVVFMVDAPTGSGKTSCISAALAAAPGKIVVVVRTVSQIDIYLDEIEKIWSNTRHRPQISYMVGKLKTCPLAGEFKGESVYAGCARMREWTKNYMSNKLRQSQGRVYDPSRDKTLPIETPEYRTFCPYYLMSREAFDLNGKAHFRHSGLLLDVADELREEIRSPDKLLHSCKGVCPYEIMSVSARSSDVVIMNYSHIFSPDFQEVIFDWLELDRASLTLFVDEAHNLGDAVRALNTRRLTLRMIDLAEREMERYEAVMGQAKLQESRLEASSRLRGVEVIKTLLPRLRKYILSRQSRMQEGEELLDADLFRTFLYQDIEDIDEALSTASEVVVAVAELKLAEGDRENLQGELEPNLAQVILFLRDMEVAETDQAYQRRIATSGTGDKKRTWLEVNNIDPAPVIRRIVDNINATVMLSGTLSPLDAYELYFLGEAERARKISLLNPFPAENRLLMAAEKATTQLEKREEAENRREIVGHIEAMIEKVPGNVAVFFTSYSMMNQYRKVCHQAARKVKKRLYLEPRSAEDVPQVLDDFFRDGKRGGAVLLGVSGGKLAEGIDYKGEALSGVVVVGLPLGFYNEIQREINAYYVRKYGQEKGMLIAYTLPAINRALQGAGRVIRDASEMGVILFCDRRFVTRDRNGVRRYLPPWIKEELIVTDALKCRDLIEAKEDEWEESRSA
ncbi:MAG: ATP-dependent DNA helicase [Euryarchaeota archaeon]|nr:ATP-dependent DNA helicase [Euryarchaeota archaeon]